MTFERKVQGLMIYRDAQLGPHEILYSDPSNVLNSIGVMRNRVGVVTVGRDVDVDALAFDLSLVDEDREFLLGIKVLV